MSKDLLLTILPFSQITLPESPLPPPSSSFSPPSPYNISPFSPHSLFSSLISSNPLLSPSLSLLNTSLPNLRYSILHSPSVGIIRGKLVNKNQFQVLWDIKFQQSSLSIDELNIDMEVINGLREVDWKLYEGFVKDVYGQEIDWKEVKKYKIQEYQGKLREYHQEKSKRERQLKIEVIKKYTIQKDIDILFLEYDDNIQDIQHIEISQNYTSHPQKQSVIFVKKQLVDQNIDSCEKFRQQYDSRLFSIPNLSYVKLENYLLCCVDFSENGVDKNRRQIEELERLVEEIREENLGLNVVVRVSGVSEFKGFRGMNIVPKNQLKLNKLIKGCIASNLEIQSLKTSTIKQLNNQTDPYPSFILSQKPPQPLHSSIYSSSSSPKQYIDISTIQKIKSTSTSKPTTIPSSTHPQNNPNHSNYNTLKSKIKVKSQANFHPSPNLFVDKQYFLKSTLYYQPLSPFLFSPTKQSKKQESHSPPNNKKGKPPLQKSTIPKSKTEAQGGVKQSQKLLQFSKSTNPSSISANNSRSKLTRTSDMRKSSPSTGKKEGRRKELNSVAYKKF